MLRKWQDGLASGLLSGTCNPLKSNHRGMVAATVKIERAHPGYMHALYRYATSTLGVKATIEELTACMNERSHIPGELRPGVNLHYKQVYRRWKANGGSEKSELEKPRLTRLHMAQRVLWIERWLHHFLREDFPVAYLDEKWFYAVTRHNLLKCLPRGPNDQRAPK